MNRVVKVRAGIRSSCEAAARLLPSVLTARAMGPGELGGINPAVAASPSLTCHDALAAACSSGNLRSTNLHARSSC